MIEYYFVRSAPHAACLLGGFYAGYLGTKTDTSVQDHQHTLLVLPTLTIGLFSLAIEKYKQRGLKKAINRCQRQLDNPQIDTIREVIPWLGELDSLKFTPEQVRIEMSQLEIKLSEISTVKQPLINSTIAALETGIGYATGRVMGTYF